MDVPQGSFVLHRYPRRKQENLRAWDAADELLLQHVDEQQCIDTQKRVLILNDSFGALTTALAQFQPHMQSDSWLAMQGTLQNLDENAIDSSAVCLSSSMEPLQGHYDTVLIRIPKSLAQLQSQLHRIRPHLDSDSIIIAAAMSKSIHRSTLQLFERIIGPTRTSLARKKARLVFSRHDSALRPDPDSFPQRYRLDAIGCDIINHAGVFSAQGLDIGTRFFLQHVPSSDHSRRIIDLGCGNGVIGLMAALRNPAANILFTDESYMAVASAEANFRATFGETRQAEFRVSDCLQDVADDSADLILNNPPFHQHHAVNDNVAWQMFQQSRRVLKKGAELWVIGNRHLGYHVKLKRLFGNFSHVASNSKFVIIKAVKH